MPFTPGLADFSRDYQGGKPVLIWTTLVADLETPVSVMLKVAADLPYSFLFESVEGGNTLGRYSLIGCKPDLIWRCHRSVAEIQRDGTSGFQPETLPPIDSLRQLIAESRIDLGGAALPPMAAGLFGYLGYDMVREIETLPDSKPDTLNVPDGLLSRPTIVIVFDNVLHTMTLFTPVRPSGVTAEAAYGAAIARLEAVLADLNQSLSAVIPAASPKAENTHQPVSNTNRAAYCAMVETAKTYIRAGDIFQVVPSHRFSIPYTRPPLQFYRALRRLNPSPFLFMLNFGEFAVVGSSPEILVRLRDGEVTIRPIAGTRKRGTNPAEDEVLAADLLADEKELAEHLMLLDLGRNDIGRVAETGSVRVTQRMAVERYSHVMHIVSNVTGRLRGELDMIDALIAGFPAGTVSGAPKIRAMQIIDQLETSRRGIYGGCIGYFGAGGDMDTCIALRTAILKDGRLSVQAGAGVVADSVAELEYEETCNKAMALLKAAEA